MASERAFEWVLSLYRHSLEWVLANPTITLIVLLLTVALNVVLVVNMPKGFFPQQDTGAIVGGVQGPQDSSFQAMNYSISEIGNVIKSDPAVANVIVFTGGGGATNTGFIYIALKPLSERKVGAAEIINRLRPRLNRLPVASVFLQAAQDLRIGGRGSNALYQYTLQSDSAKELAQWGPILLNAMKHLPGLQDVNSDQQNGGRDELLTFDRVTAAKLGLTVQALDTALYNAFGQAEVSVIYTQLNQYYVVLEVAPQYWQSPEGFKYTYLPTKSNNGHIPLFTVANNQANTIPLAINHTGLFPSVTVSFNLAPNVSLSEATTAHSGDAERARHTDYDPRLFCGHAAGLPTIAEHDADPGCHGAAGRIHRSRDSLRKLDPSRDDYLHSALSGGGRHAGINAIQSRSQRDFHHRHRAAYRHRQKERHHDDRFRPAGRAAGRKGLRRFHI